MSARDDIHRQSESDRELELLCAIVRHLIDLGVKLGELTTLAQQQNDLLRRLVERSRDKCNFGKENQPEPTSAKSVFNKNNNKKGK